MAEEALRESCKRMRLDVQFLRKSRAIGCFPTRAEVFFFEAHADPCTIPPSSRTIGYFPKAIPFLPLFNFNFLGEKDRIAYEALEDVALAIQDKMTQKSTFGPAGYIYIYIYCRLSK